MCGKQAFDIQRIGNLQRLKNAYAVGQFVEEEWVLKEGKLKIKKIDLATFFLIFPVTVGLTGLLLS